MIRLAKWLGSSVESSIRATSNPHSLDQLKILCRLLEKNQTVSESNRTLLVETLRQIAEILIWGDQNDSSVFDFFLEKNMLYFFLNIMKQKCGGYVCTQLLQTLNILFENIKNETSLYYLLSNNHVNSIIIQKFDFSNEEVMAYYISFLKTLSLKLNSHTIHFFFNENTADFPLYTEAIKFFNHPEKMVRIAVRTLTLNVFRVREKAMLRFIRDCTAAPYFSNLSWFIGNHILDLNTSLNTYIELRNQQHQGLLHSSNLINRLEDLIAEHLDHLHYLNDILLLNIDDLNIVLSDNLLYRLLIPLYMHSFLRIDCKFKIKTLSPKQVSAILSPTVAIFLLSQAFLIISYGTLLKALILALMSNKIDIELIAQKCDFTQPITSLEAAIEQAIMTTSNQNSPNSSETFKSSSVQLVSEKTHSTLLSTSNDDQISESEQANNQQINLNSKNNLEQLSEDKNSTMNECNHHIDWQDCSFLVALLASLNTTIVPNSKDEHNIKNAKSQQGFNDKTVEKIGLHKSCHSPQIIKLIPEWTSSDDRVILFALSLITAIITNKAIESRIYENIFAPCHYMTPSSNSFYNTLVNSLLLIMRQCSSSASSIRLITFELAVYLFRRLTCFYMTSIAEINQLSSDDGNNSQSEKKVPNHHAILSDHQIALLEQACEDACHLLRHYYCLIDKSIFINMFEKEAKIFFQDKLSKRSPSENSSKKVSIWSYDFNVNLEQLFMDATLLLPPNEISRNDESNFHLRLPTIDYEKAHYIIKVFFVMRLLSFDVRKMMGDNTDDEKIQDFSILFDESQSSNSISLDHFIDLENCDLNSCSVSFYHPVNQRQSFSSNDRRNRCSQSAPGSRSESPSLNHNDHFQKMPFFMAIVSELIILIEPDDKRYGWGIIRFISRLQDIEKIVIDLKELNDIHTMPPLPEKDDTKSLYIYFGSYLLSSSLKMNAKVNNIFRSSIKNRTPSIVARFQFNDTVRGLVARINLYKARKKVIERKIYAVADLIDLPSNENISQATSSKTTTQQLGSSKSGEIKSGKSDHCNHHHNHHHRHNHPTLNRTYAVPGVAVLSNFTSTESLNSPIVNSINKKRYMYPPAVSIKSKVISTTNIAAKTSAENERVRKKKLKFPNNTGNDIGTEDYGIPLNDLSPKTLRKDTTTSISTVAALSATEWQENSNALNANLNDGYEVDEDKNPNYEKNIGVKTKNETMGNSNNNNNNNSVNSHLKSSSSSLSNINLSETFDI